MPRSTATTKRWLAAAVSLTLAAGWLWIDGLARLGVATPGTCTWSSPDGTQRLSVAESIESWRRIREEAGILPRASVSCSFLGASAGDPALSPRGLNANGERLFAAVRNEFGDVSYGGFEPGGAKSGHIAGSDHYSGRAIDYFFRPHTSDQVRLQGWQLAQWAVINAERLDITLVIFDDQIWSRSASALGWRPYTHPDGPTDNPIKRHLDHVHISVS